ncbi:Hypothetical predicted protein [Podarcis lilfordi]|uniref:Uncharacterized protein n=1 Tax=Podarcis lilfordi TaxID=74358 RepID=A0AA35KMA1_9SAUR|nr:Hypothetical predicted protein [Podarcis lilfordi]
MGWAPRGGGDIEDGRGTSQEAAAALALRFSSGGTRAEASLRAGRPDGRPTATRRVLEHEAPPPASLPSPTGHVRAHAPPSAKQRARERRLLLSPTRDMLRYELGSENEIPLDNEGWNSV